MHVHCSKFIRYHRAWGEKQTSLSAYPARSDWEQSSPGSLTWPWQVSAPVAGDINLPP